MSMHDAVRAKLQERLERLLGRVGKIEGDLRRTHDRDWEEQAIELENDEVLAGLDTLSRAEVNDIREALARIEAGDYGVCAKCGQAIGEERLVALPSTATCVGCAK
jgi:DnaK suppressor protein